MISRIECTFLGEGYIYLYINVFLAYVDIVSLSILDILSSSLLFDFSSHLILWNICAFFHRAYLIAVNINPLLQHFNIDISSMQTTWPFSASVSYIHIYINLFHMCGFCYSPPRQFQGNFYPFLYPQHRMINIQNVPFSYRIIMDIETAHSTVFEW